MKTNSACLLIGLLLTLAPLGTGLAARAADTGRGVTVAPVSATAPSGNAGLFVGVNRFVEDESLQLLRFAVNDAIAQAHLFVIELKLIPPSSSFLALSGEPTTDSAKAQLAALTKAGTQRVSANKARVLLTVQTVANLPGAEADMLVVSLSSHGFEEQNLAYVMPSDGVRTSLRDTALSLNTIEQKLADSKAGKRLLLVDACREKATKESKGGDTAMSAAFRDALAAAEGQATLASCDAGQLSLENPNLGHGVFTYFLLEALHGKAAPDPRGFITLGSVSDYLGKVVPDWIQKNRPEATRSMVQKPWFKGPKIAEQIPLAVDPGIRARLGAFKANVTQAVDALRTKINRKGAFNLALYDRLADALEKSQDDEAGRKLLQRSQDFISGKMDEEVFVAYLEKTLATPEQRMARLAQISAARPKVQTTIASEISARVSAVKVNVGDSVRTGDVLATLDDSELRTQLELATTDFKRTTQLFEQQLVPRAEYDTAQTNYHLATEMLKRATVVAPFDGVVVSNLCEVGGFAQQHQPLFVLEHTQPATGKLGDTKTLDLGKGVKMELVWIPPGEFMMGSNDGQDNEKPLHRVRLTKGFWMGKYEVTQEQYEAVIGSNPSKFKGSDNPVGNVSWDDAVAFCRKAGGRLPTEAEWEYACRAGTTTKYHSGDTDNDLARVAWYGSNSDNNPHPVGGKLANTWGLHDMHGNVWEWCADWYGDYPNSDAVDPTGPGSGQDRVLRGGSWNCYSVSCRSVHRYKFSPDVGIISNGFRVIVDAPEAGAPQLREHVQTPQVAPERIGTSRVPKLGDTKRLDLGKGVKLELVWIPPGEFMMGSAEYVPVHRVKLTKGFWMGKYEVTQEQYEAIMGSNPSSSKGANNPVELVSWDNAVGFCRKVGGRLPTEAEWEYACRAGTTTKYSSGDTESDLARVGWYGDNSGNTAHSVGGKEANAWGLYDMHGNVFEWCADWYGSYPNNEETNPTGAGSGDERVLRGGSWAVKPDACGSAVRLKSSPHLRNAWGVSFRVCLDFP